MSRLAAAAERFTTADLARRYAQAEFGTRATGDASLNPGHEAEFEGKEPRPAAVLVPVVDRAEATVLLTLRPATMRQHAGQIAFPGGSLDPGETELEAALREAREEVGLEERHVSRLLGPLPRYRTGSGFIITPFLAVVDARFEPVPEPAEVEEAFEVPLGFLMDGANHVVGEGVWRGRTRRFWNMPYREGAIERRIWGATAGILRTMHEDLYPAA